MRLITLCLSLGAVLSASVTVLAQEIIAPEEWFQSMKLSRGLVTRKVHNSNKHAKNQHHHHRSRSSKAKLNQRSISDVQAQAAFRVPRLQKRVKGFPPRSEIEQRAKAFQYFQADAIVDAPVMLHIVKDTPPPSTQNRKTATAAKGNERMEKAGKKVKKIAKKVAAKRKNKNAKRHLKSKKARKHGKKAASKKHGKKASSKKLKQQ